MYLIKKFYNNSLKKYLINLQKQKIFPIGNNIGQQISGLYEYYNDTKHQQIKPLINFNLHIFNLFNIKINDKKIFIENRELILDNPSIPFESTLHQDSIEDNGDSCYTCVYYYQIDKTIIGGELLFPPFGKYNPKNDEIIIFDGDTKHKINKTTGFGKRGTLIINFAK